MDIETVLETLKIQLKDDKDVHDETIFKEEVNQSSKEFRDPVIDWCLGVTYPYNSLYTMIRKVKHGKKSGIYKRDLDFDQSKKDDLLLKLNYKDVGAKFLIVYHTNTDYPHEKEEEIYIYGFEGENANVISYYPNPKEPENVINYKLDFAPINVYQSLENHNEKSGDTDISNAPFYVVYEEDGKFIFGKIKLNTRIEMKDVLWVDPLTTQVVDVVAALLRKVFDAAVCE